MDAVDDQSDQVTAAEQSPTKMLAVFSRSFSWCAFLLGPTIFEELDELFGDENRIVCVLPARKLNVRVFTTDITLRERKHNKKNTSWFE